MGPLSRRGAPPGDPQMDAWRQIREWVRSSDQESAQAALESILDLHRPSNGHLDPVLSPPLCHHCEQRWPCTEVQIARDHTRPPQPLTNQE